MGVIPPRAHRHHLLIARGSLAETDSWLDQLRRHGWITVEEEQPLLQECEEITAMLTSKILKLDHNIGKDGAELHESQAMYEVSVVELVPPFPFLPEDYC